MRKNTTAAAKRIALFLFLTTKARPNGNANSSILPAPPRGVAVPNRMVFQVKLKGSLTSAAREVPMPYEFASITVFSRSHNGLLKIPFSIGRTGLPVHRYVKPYHGVATARTRTAHTTSVFGRVRGVSFVFAGGPGLDRGHRGSRPYKVLDGPPALEQEEFTLVRPT